MVNLTDPNSYQPGGRTWAVAFVGTAGNLELMTANAATLMPSPSLSSTTAGDADNVYSDDESVAFWPVDSAAITISEVQGGESAAAAAEAETEGNSSDSSRAEREITKSRGGLDFPCRVIGCRCSKLLTRRLILEINTFSLCSFRVPWSGRTVALLMCMRAGFVLGGLRSSLQLDRCMCSSLASKTPTLCSQVDVHRERLRFLSMSMGMEMSTRTRWSQ